MGLDIPIPVIVFGGIALLVGLGMAAGVYYEKKRREALQRMADELGLTFYGDGDPGLIAEISDLPLFSKGRSRRLTNLILGETDETTMGVFDYRYTVGSGKNSQTYRQTVAFFRSGDLKLPVFEMRPQSFFHGIGKMFGYQDIDFETHRNFSRAFILRGPNETHVRQFFRPTVLEYFERNQGVCVEGRLHDVVFYRHGKRVKPEQIKELMNEGFQVFTALRQPSEGAAQV